MIIPIFVPHEGCPNDCAFCNQRTISGKSMAPTTDEARSTIEEYLSGGKTAEQIAFFGGSFTGIDIKKQNEYLSLAQEYIRKGLVKSIRLSTRPDYIDADTVQRLISYGVKNIELGAQSMDEDILHLSKRGHSAENVEKAAEIINGSGAVLGLQMMTGLPGDTPQKCLYTARRFKELGAKETRIYPTVVLRGTYLEKMLKKGEYTPQSVEDAVEISAKLYRFFTQNGISVLRIGLPDGEDLRKNYKFNETCQESVPQAIYCFLISEDFVDCLRTTISIGGDCDTTAAISCAIAEAYYDEIPLDLIEAVKSKLPKEMLDIIEDANWIYMMK